MRQHFIHHEPGHTTDVLDGFWMSYSKIEANDGEAVNRYWLGIDKHSASIISSKSTEEDVSSWKAGASEEMSTSSQNTELLHRSFSPEEGNKSILPEENISQEEFDAKYQQLEELGKGGFGFVFAGHRKSDSLPVAIKHIPNISVEDELQKAAGGPEAIGKSAAVSLLDWYYLDKELILVMERPVPSMELSDYLISRGGSMDESEAKILQKQLVDAAIDLHTKGVFHQDIKCTNVLVEYGSGDPHIRIIDFGCGSFLQRKPFWKFRGTLELAPPEWHIRKKFKAGPTTVWQLGALLYRLLHGNMFHTMAFVSSRIGLSTELSQECLDFLQLCLAVRPKQRATLQQMKHHPWLNT
ncbi:serine/threonine-protein kinase pim-2-like isoform X2 [Nerophis lumbriciformis]|uniref:serine/threonine-protein kinase pim-2-like isoform X2 n=1 Tax=Nerophis lumbriciformis TaxID=546530 RepID=UPI002AE017D8|nr:serine/threonine-protein kinase pim-2-like isoform X2 [Nerophis lumbriciformis]